MPFGPDITSYLTWFRQHGDQELYEILYQSHNIHSIVCGITGAAAAGWFNHPINEIAELKQLKIAATGLASRVYKHTGATTVNIAPVDLQNALKLKQVHAVAFSTPAADQYLGLQKFFKYYYFPGWFQQAGIVDLMINLANWDSLTKTQQKMIETTCMANIEYSLSPNESMQFEALKNMAASGVDVRKFSPQLTQKLKRAWLNVARSSASKNKSFRRVLISLRKFRKDYSIWHDLGKI